MFEANPVDLAILLDNAGSGKIQLPNFQRDWVWDDDRIKGLLSSVSRQFPIGAILTLEGGGKTRLRSRPIQGVSEQEAPPEVAEIFLLDGQQRLTALYQSLKHEAPVVTRISRNRRRVERWYYVKMLDAMDPSIDRDDAFVSVDRNRKGTTDFGQESVRDLSTQELEFQHHLMPTERLLDTAAASAWDRRYINYWERVGGHPKGDPAAFLDNFVSSVKRAFRSYKVPVIRLDKENSREAVCTVFEKVNRGGIPLSTFDLVTATFAAEGANFSLRDDWEKRKSRLHNRYAALQGIGGDQFLQAVVLLVSQDKRRKDEANGEAIRPVSCKPEAMLQLSYEDYQRRANEVEAGFEAAARFLGKQFVFTQKDVPYNAQLVPLAALHVELGDELESDDAKDKLERWFWSAIFGEDYGSATETKSARDLVDVANWIRGGETPASLNEASFEPARLIGLQTRASAAYKGLYALQMKKGAKDWRSATPMSTDIVLNTGIDIHHIFPKKWCQEQNQYREDRLMRLCNSVINKTPIDRATNRKIGGKAPSAYLRLLRQSISADDLDAVLWSHWVNPGNLSSDDFAKHFEERGEELLQLIGEAMGKPMSSGRDAFRETLHSARRADDADEFDGEEDEEHDPLGGEAYDEDFGEAG